MNRIKNLPRLLCLLIALVVVGCCVASFAYQRAAAQAFNGKIAFVNEQAIYTINADGSGLIRLTPMDPIYDQSPSWSPEGAKIVCDRRVVAAKAQIYVMNADGSNIRRLTNTTLDEHQLAWQPLASAPTPTPTPTPTPSPAPTPNWTISGTVTDSTGKALADVTMVLQNSAADTQIIFTDQNGKYTFHYSGGNSIFVTPVKSNFIFNPASLGFISSGSVTGDKTADFVGTASPIAIAFPILLGRESPARAVALDSVTMISEPFVVTNTHNFSADQHTRVTLFAVSIDLNPGEPLSVIQAQAEDSLGQVFPLTVEYFGAVPNFPWLKQVVVKLPDEIANKVEVRVSLKLRGLAGNKVIIKVAP